MSATYPPDLGRACPNPYVRYTGRLSLEAYEIKLIRETNQSTGRRPAFHGDPPVIWSDI